MAKQNKKDISLSKKTTKEKEIEQSTDWFDNHMEKIQKEDQRISVASEQSANNLYLTC